MKRSPQSMIVFLFRAFLALILLVFIGCFLEGAYQVLSVCPSCQ